MALGQFSLGQNINGWTENILGWECIFKHNFVIILVRGLTLSNFFCKSFGSVRKWAGLKILIFKRYVFRIWYCNQAQFKIGLDKVKFYKEILEKPYHLWLCFKTTIRWAYFELSIGCKRKSSTGPGLTLLFFIDLLLGIQIHLAILKFEGKFFCGLLRVYELYRACTIITRSWFEFALDYKLRILDSRFAAFPCLVHKLSAILTALQHRP